MHKNPAQTEFLRPASLIVTLRHKSDDLCGFLANFDRGLDAAGSVSGFLDCVESCRQIGNEIVAGFDTD